MRNECMGLINLDRKGSPSISKLSYARPISSIPIAGRYRVIDFILSNMVNSRMTNVGIYAKVSVDVGYSSVLSVVDKYVGKSNGIFCLIV